MKLAINALVLLTISGAIVSQAQISSFEHVVVVFQENRTPDNLFHGLCSAPYGTANSCSTKPTTSQYNIQTKNWLDKHSSTGVAQPSSVALANAYDLGHVHKSFTQMCDVNKTTGACRMDGAGDVFCSGTCVSKPQFKYVDNSKGNLNPYLDLATQYGWANYMFQTNQGPSYPAHQYIFGGTSAPSADDDAIGTYAEDNVHQPGKSGTAITGCIALAGSTVDLITATGEIQSIYPCFEHQTLADLLDGINVSWRYYTPDSNNLWTAPNAIQHICAPDAPTGGKCTGPDWTKNVVVGSSKVLTDISSCKLAQVSWVMPDGKNSDHAQSNTGGGPDWVASIVNAIGNNAKCADDEKYWNNTAIIITWDDWGGWYDHEPPTILAQPFGDYQYGFRVPLIVVSAYTKAGYINNNRFDFGSILRFIEHNYGIEQGALNFADARISTNLTKFFNLSQAPRDFKTIQTTLDASYFINDTSPAVDPDDY
ncbi:MAG TPA: alkaline phosphatase family protein [Candidatus Sulfotelmatobacter sp.]|nr:alkaline phosphatase family protein [Candidatus Sulfotelmatobacter sp.]